MRGLGEGCSAITLAIMIPRGVTSFFRWWVRQIAQLVPARLLQFFLEAGEASILEITEQRFALFVRRRGRLTPVAQGPLSSLQQTVKTTADLPQLRLLKTPEAQVLRKHLSLPLAVRRDLHTVLSFEIDRETPFELGEVYWNYRATATKARLDVELVVVPRTAVDTLAQVARDHGFVPAALDVAHDDGPSPLLWLEAPNPLRYTRLPARVRLPMAVVYGLAVALLLVPFAAQQMRFFLADRTIAALGKDAREASDLNRKANLRVAALTFMSGSNLGQNGPLEILAATTKALPDDTYLTSLAVHGGQITVIGSSEAAAQLIGAMAGSPQFRDPAFDSAVLEGDDGEKFSISAQLASASPP